MYAKDDTVDHVNQPLIQVGNIRRCWEECLEKSNYHQRRNEVEQFNRYFDIALNTHMIDATFYKPKLNR